MALYDDDDDDDVPAVPVPKEAPKPEPSPAPNPSPSFSSKISLKFLQTQIQQKRTAQPAPNPMLSMPKPSPAGVVDLTGRSRLVPIKPLKPVVAKALADSVLPMFVNKAAMDDKVLMFGEITIEREYQPACPNDFYLFKKKKEEQEAREKAAREIADRLEREHKEEMGKREKGAAFAPPSSLQLSPPREKTPPKVEESATKFTPPAAFKPFGQSGRGLGVAANIMSKMGYREGSGLGRSEQGISTAIVMEKTGKGGMGMIIEPPPTQAPPAPMSQQAISEAMKTATKVVLLKNMVTEEDVDDELEPEIREEMAKYGQVVDVIIHKMSTPSSGDEVRIFVEFTNVAQAIKAFIVQSGRFFAGRPVQASFYPMDEFTGKQYE